jgi:uncharacterized surface protein with fasciclin (FAS1) repeats
MIVSPLLGIYNQLCTFPVKELINMVEKEDIELDFNIFEPTISAFAELFNEHEKMKVNVNWYYYTGMRAVPVQKSQLLKHYFLLRSLTKI